MSGIYKVGDVLLKEGFDKASWWIKFGNAWTRWFRKSKAVKYSHTGIFVNEESIVEALPEGIKVHRQPYEDKFAVYRKKNLTEEECVKLRNSALEDVGKEYSYFLATMIACLKVLRLEKFINGTRYEGSICSVVVAKAYDRIGYSFRKNESVDFIDPGDIAEHVMASDGWEKVVE